jgi:hypothetical protein
MAAEDIERDSPSLTRDNYKPMSDEDFNYNCLAFVLGIVRTGGSLPESLASTGLPDLNAISPLKRQ